MNKQITEQNLFDRKKNNMYLLCKMRKKVISNINTGFSFSS